MAARPLIEDDSSPGTTIPKPRSTTASSAPRRRPSRPKAASASSPAISAAPASRSARSIATAGRSRLLPASSSHQQAVQDAFKAGELDRDVVVVVRFQGPQANGMPELHKLTPPLGVLQEQGLPRRLGHRRPHVGRLGQGAGGDPPLARSAGGGPIGKVRDGDVIRVCAESGVLEALVDPAEWDAREHAAAPPPAEGTGRELFAMMRLHCDEAELGASAMLAQAGL
jgi:hypothetical protein